MIAYPIVTRSTRVVDNTEALAIWRYRSAFAQHERPLLAGPIDKRANTRHNWLPFGKKEK